MSKLGPLGQSMAALFSPDRAAKSPNVSETKGSAAPKSSFKVPGGPIGADKSGDSLGNPNSPGYEPLGKRKEKENPSEQKPETAPLAEAVEAPVQGSNLIRLSIGWDKLLVAQKKICEKAKGLFTKMEGPENYADQKRKLKFRKSSGCILDVDSVDSAPRSEKTEDPKKNIA